MHGLCTGGRPRNIQHPQIPHQPPRLLQEQFVLKVLHPSVSIQWRGRALGEARHADTYFRQIAAGRVTQVNYSL